MKYWLSAIIAAGLVLAPVAGQAATRKHHRSHMQPAGQASAQPVPATNSGLHMPTAADPTGGNAALQGNNATSMFGSNAAADNANGRTSGGGGFGH